MKKENLIEIKNVTKNFELAGNTFTAVNSVSLTIKEGETLGLVGESGSGKSTLGRLINRIYKPTAGEILYKGKGINSISKSEFSKTFQMIFQDPYASLNPRMTVGDIIAEGLDIHFRNKIFGVSNNEMSKRDRKEKVISLLKEVGMNEEHMNRFPHEFSGGQRQRIGIARALAINPKFIVCDEPISALDVSIQAQVVNLLKKLQKEHNLTYLFISHDLSMVRYISDRVAVMYKGRIVELGERDKVIFNPVHPYTQSLIDCIPSFDGKISREKREEHLKNLKKLDFSNCSLKEIKPGHFAAV